MSFSGYPASLRFLFSKLTGFARNRVKQPVLTPTQCNPNDLLIIELSANQKIDLSTLAIMFTIDTTCSGGTTPSCLPPRYTNSLIQQMSVDVNGMNVFNLDNYNHLNHLMMSWTGGDRTQQLGTLLEFSNNYTGQVNSTTLTNVPLCFKNFLGFLGNNKILDTGILGPIRITLRLAPSSVLVLNGSPTSYTYKLNNMSVQYDVITIQDGIYDQMIANRLSSGDTIPIVYNNYLSFLGASSTTPDQCTNRVPCNVSSLDYVHHTLLPTDYTTNQTLRNGTSGYFYKGDSNNSLYGCQLQIGSTYIPNFRQVYPAEMLVQTMDSIGIGQDLLGSTDPNLKNNTITAATSSNALANIYTGGFFLHSTRLCHGTDFDYGSKLVSGLDCRGANTMVSATTYAATGGAPVFPLTYLQFSSQLLVGANRQLQLIM